MTNQYLKSIIAGCFLLIGQLALGAAVGPANTTPGLILMDIDAGVAPGGEQQFDIGGPSERIGLSFDASAGPFQQGLALMAPVNNGDIILVHEYLLIDSGPAWTDWNQEVVSPDFIWSSGTVMIGGSTAPGLVTSGLGTSTIWFNFDPIASGTSVDIWKELTYAGIGASPMSMTLEMNPAAVPVPPAVWLFMSAVGVLGWMRRNTQ